MGTSNPEHSSVQEKDSEGSMVDSTKEQTPKDKDVEDHYMSGAKLHILIVGLGIAIFIMALDMSILATAIPVITEKFQSTDDIGWYLSGYLLTL